MADLYDLLEKTSRTFALSIPLLPEPTRGRVATTYLLFRIADTFEDAALWPRDRRIEALAEFARLLERPADAAPSAERWAADPPVAHDGYVELVREIPFVLDDYRAMPEPVRTILRRHLLRTARGMADVVRRSGGDGDLRLRSIADLRGYCYIVAGIVGEMLSELYVHDWPALSPSASYLLRRAPFFGEGLQLVNILKDAASDLTEGRSYVPAGADRGAVFALARADLDYARQYVAALERRAAPEGLIAFNALPVLLAQASLDRVEERGPSAKLTRPEVFDVVEKMNAALSEGRPTIPRSRAPVI